jgi:hypothetical protein
MLENTLSCLTDEELIDLFEDLEMIYGEDDFDENTLLDEVFVEGYRRHLWE